MIPISQKLKNWLQTLGKDDNWCILITADPDALASAMALKRILSRRVHSVVIANTNTITRPDNLAMIRYLRIPLVEWQADMKEQFSHFALVDSQPHHHPAFEGINFSVVIDHHPEVAEFPVAAPFIDIRPAIGATSTLLTRYLRFLKIRPGRLLSTALLYGIRTDTAVFERSGTIDDFNAYQWLFHYADNTLLRRITRSEYLRSWLPLFGRAFRSLHPCRGNGAHTHLGDVSNGDLLVAIADFFTRVHGLKWIAVSGVVTDTVVIVFRGDGSRDIGRLAMACFQDVGTAGGHHALARAEFPLSAIPAKETVRDFVFQRLAHRRLYRADASPAKETSSGE